MYLLLRADQRLKQNQGDVFLPPYPQELYPLGKELGPILSQKIIRPSLIQCRNNGDPHREEDGAIEFWRLKDDLQNKFEYSQHWSDDVRKSKMTGGGGNNKRFQYCTDPSGQEILYFRALQDHSGRNPNDPLLQDNVLIPDDFFEYIYHIGCAVNLHSITNAGLIAGPQNF